MPCEACLRNKKRQLEARRKMLAQRQAKLEAACADGDELACRTLAELNAAQAYREQNRFRGELHRRAG